MKDEKILKEEIISEEQLEEVAGGYGQEIKDDKLRFAKLRYLRDENASDGELINVFNQFGYNVEIHHGYFTENKYWLNGRQMNRNEVWNEIYHRLGFQ